MPVDKFGRMSDLKTEDAGVSLTYINNNYVRSDGQTPLTGSLDMRGNTLYNVADPVNPQDVVTKIYVDNTKGSGVIGRKTDKGVSIKENMDFLEKQRIKNLPAPVEDGDAVSREYVENIAINNPFDFVNGKYEAKADINLNNLYTVYNVKEPIEDGAITDKKYVDEQINLNSPFSKRGVAGFEAKENIFMRRNKILGLREPIQDGEAANKKYVDDVYNNLVNQYIDEDDNLIIKRNVNMEDNQVFNLPDPVNDQDAVNKKYVDNLQTQNIDQKGNIKFGRNINLDNKRIFGMKGPTKPKEGANKEYVDNTITQRIQEEKDNFLPKDAATKNYVDETIKALAGGDAIVSKEGVFIKENGHYRATAPLDIDNQKMENIPDPVDDKDAVNKKYIDEAFKELTLKKGLVRENGGFNLSDSYINMNHNNIRNVGRPKEKGDATPRFFVENLIKDIEEKIKKNGKKLFLTESGNYKTLASIDMNFNNIKKVGIPKDNTDAAPLFFIEDMIKDFKESINSGVRRLFVNNNKKRTHLITANASFHGDLIKGKYQFIFGGPNNPTYEKHDALNGFLMPHGGYIRRFVLENFGVGFDTKLLSNYQNVPIPLFTLILIKSEGIDIIELGTFNIIFSRDNLGDLKFVYSFRSKVGDLKKYQLFKKDIINVRTEYTTYRGFNGFNFTERSFSFDKTANEFYVNLVSVLIELDPLGEEDD